MSARLVLLRRFFPAPLKLWMLRELARVTAEGFGTKVPAGVRHGSFEARRAAYAEFTAEEAARLEPADITAVKARLRRGAAGLGAAVRGYVGLRRPTETFEAWKLLYHELGIEVGGRPRGELTITRCFFADYYDEAVCSVIEALDDGFADGLFGGANLVFSTRLTSDVRTDSGASATGGRPCCRAILRLAPRGLEEER